jgi:ATP-binding cassette subfamily B protein
MLGFIPSLGLAVVLFAGGRAVISGDLSLGAFTTFYLFLLMLMGPMRMLGLALGMAQRAVASGNRLFEILDREPQIESPPDAPPLPAGGGRVEMRGVSLRYDGAAPAKLQSALDSDAERSLALDGIDLAIDAGRTVALVGPSGSGKTSLVALIARLYDPGEGAVSIDGADVRSVDLVSLRSQVAFVGDDSFLFSASIAENIAYAHPGASRERVEAAARRAQADDFVRDLPGGYDTVVGERGLTLSGGQRQRIAIARALLQDPLVLVLDEATSAVDQTTEARIIDAVDRLFGERTRLVISHRPATLRGVDRLIELADGRLIDRRRAA